MRAWPLVFVAVAAAGASVVTVREHAARDGTVAQARDRAASGAAVAVQETLKRRSKALTDEVAVLATNEQLRLGIATDAQTVQNQITEEALSNLRSHEVYAIGRNDPQNPGRIELLIAHGLEQVSSDLINGLPAVGTALGSPSAPAATGTLALPVGLALVAVAPVTSHDQMFRGYLLVGERLGRRSLEPLALETRTALLLSDGSHDLGFAGVVDCQPTLAAAIGSEASWSSATLTDATGNVAARAIAIAPPLYLWVATNIATEADTLRKSAELNVVITWFASLGTGVALALGLMLRGRNKPPGVETAPNLPAPLPGTTPPGPTLSGPQAPGITGSGASSGGQVLAPPPPADPSIFGRYKLLDRLGSGGMAEVWTAVVYGAEGFRRPFVVKRIRSDMESSEALVQQFIDEANLQSQLVHSNIVPVFDFGNLNGEYYLAQEYILGRDLGKITSALAKRGRRLDPALAIYVLAEIVKALDYAHTLTDKSGRPQGIVHRDVSPNNILCSIRGEVKLIDFGIAKSVSKVGQTEVGTVKGNLRFMSPEQAQGIPVDARSDLFSLGMSLYFTQSGESLYTASGPYDLLLLAARGPGADDLAKIRALAPPLNELLLYALSPGLDARCQSAQALLEAVLPLSPSDGARRLAALLTDLFGEELRLQEQRFSDAIGAAAAPPEDDATVQRLSPKLRQGLS